MNAFMDHFDVGCVIVTDVNLSIARLPRLLALLIHKMGSKFQAGRNLHVSGNASLTESRESRGDSANDQKFFLVCLAGTFLRNFNICLKGFQLDYRLSFRVINAD